MNKENEEIYEFKNIDDLTDCVYVYANEIPDVFKFENKVFLRKSRELLIRMNNAERHFFVCEDNDEWIEYIWRNVCYCELLDIKYKREGYIYEMYELIEADAEISDENIRRFEINVLKSDMNE